MPPVTGPSMRSVTDSGPPRPAGCPSLDMFGEQSAGRFDEPDRSRRGRGLCVDRQHRPFAVHVQQNPVAVVDQDRIRWRRAFPGDRFATEQQGERAGGRDALAAQADGLSERAGGLVALQVEGVGDGQLTGLFQ